MSDALVLVINSGSSSLKFALMDAQTGDAVISGAGECFGRDDARMSWKVDGEKTEKTLSAGSNHHQEAMDIIVGLIESNQLSDKLQAVGHRVVHGGETFSQATLIDDAVLAQIDALKALAPLHNPAHVVGIKAARKAFPSLPQVAVFDTAFHQTMPEKAYHYAISRQLYNDYGIRRYGFHGTSHYYVSREAAKWLNQAPEQTNVITVHLGNGASLCAVKDGQSVDTSMGFTPLAGLMMGTRCGDIDPSILEFLSKKGLSTDEIHHELLDKAGLLGVSELTNDCRGLVEAAEQSHKGAQLALEMFAYRVAKYIASYMVPLSRLDAIVFTGGIGENSLPVREMILKELAIFGYQADADANAAARFGAAGKITTQSSPLALVIPTNEELVIAQQAMAMA
ncbi:acetate kinase [Salinivibrio sp. IB868]|uniref:acetate kinase n=1 Tax=unclassified Salinivibrio TaxID=2636825 RepID=UPI000986FDA5|nr:MULTISPECIES: acetate kinase [unclassified Salinivibrio]OOE67569.1 acetate kinase [Salinivibrio sp. IB868]OOE71786.1 acetate kinase [Salinivibrio sp. IB870]